MNNDTPDERRYTEQEVGVILQTAAELQLRAAKGADDALGARDGLSLVELEAIAAEAGLDVALVRRAATRLGTQPPPPAGGGFVGTNTRITVERELPGELPASAFELVADVIRRHTGTAHDGKVTISARSLLWTLTELSGRTTVSVATRFGRTLVHVDRRLTDYAAGLFLLLGLGGSMAGGGGALALMLGTAMTGLAATGVGALAMGGTYLLGRRMVRRKVDASEREMHVLADVVAASVAEAIAAEGARPPDVSRAND
jgi:hypothetical protein